MIIYNKVIEDGDDLRDWAINEGWSIDDVIEQLDEEGRWDEAYVVLDYGQENMSDTEINDFLRFRLDDIGFFEEEE